MLKTLKLKEHSFLVYGLGLTGVSVVRFFKKKNFSIFKFMMTQRHIFLKIIEQKI